MKAIKIYLYVLLAGSIMACEQLVEIELPKGAENIVVESQITNRVKQWEVKVSKTQAYYNQDSVSGVENAIVIISDNAGLIDTLTHVNNGVYKTVSARQCIPGNTYTLNVEYEGISYTASETCPEQYEIDTFLSYYIPENNGFIEKGWYAFEIAKEWEEDGNYYEWKIYRNDTLLDGFGFLLDEDRYREQSFFNLGIDPQDPLSGIQDGKYPRPFPFKFEPGEEVYLEQFSISRGYYRFLIELQNQLNRSGTPFDPPPSNPHSNVNNGAFGYFSVANVVSASTLIVE